MLRLSCLAIFALLQLTPQAWADASWMGNTIRLAPDVYNSGDLTKQDSDYSEVVFGSAKTAAQQSEPSCAFEQATLALSASPNLADARRVLGYSKSGTGEWLTPFQAKQRERGYRWHARFGWLKPDEVARYEAGERRVGRRWVTAEEDAERHAKIDEGWTVRTDHFAVTTNHSLEAGARLAAELEDVFQVWRQMFAGYWLSDREVAALFEGERNARKRSRPMQVYYHRDREGYVAHLRRRQPRIGETLGIYFDAQRESHFFHTDNPEQRDQLRATLYHEAAHQLFAENGPGRRGAGRDANFWLIEGVACYFEMLAPVAGEARFTLGDPAQGRLPSAVVDGPAAPLAELAPLGRTDLQRRTDLAAVYAQATGLVAMLRHGEPADREALVRTLRAVYGGRPDGEELARQTGRSLAELDRDYARFLKGFDVAEQAPE
ncbi:hypothetical protein MalM25_32630 [Planctomycetes bacterium MalM25]|nr:hypothetical protein MalM25_32630 [Planctomycetes bacterium MalM25]